MIVLPVLAGLAGLALMGNPPRRRKRRKTYRCNPGVPHIRRIDEIIEPTAHAGRGDEEYGDPKHDDQGIVWKGDPELSDEDNAANAVYDVLKRAGANQPSSSHYHPSMWYSTEAETDWRDGTVRSESYFLTGSDAFKRAVAQEFVRQRLGRIHLSNPGRKRRSKRGRKNPPYRYLSGKTCVSPTSGLTYKVRFDTDYQEWQVAAFKNGKFQEGPTYYAADKDDALGVLAACAAGKDVVAHGNPKGWTWAHAKARQARGQTRYRLANGDILTAAQMRRTFMGKIPGPTQRRLLGITKIR